jgi:hypothetical protein
MRDTEKIVKTHLQIQVRGDSGLCQSASGEIKKYRDILVFFRRQN